MAVVSVPVQASAALAASADDGHGLSASTAPEVPVGTEAALDDATLQQAAASALADWASAAPDADLSGISFTIADLPGLEIGNASGRAVAIDVDGAGWGWSTSFPADPSAHLDLASTLRHEVGHVLGLEHSGSGLMAESLAVGEVRTISADDAAAAQPVAPPTTDTTTTTEVPVEPAVTDTSTSTSTSTRPPGRRSSRGPRRRDRKTCPRRPPRRGPWTGRPRPSRATTDRSTAPSATTPARAPW
jgi:hypothetical protein